MMEKLMMELKKDTEVNNASTSETADNEKENGNATHGERNNIKCRSEKSRRPPDCFHFSW